MIMKIDAIVREEKFEDTVMHFPKNLEKSLTNMFGDYMQLPPVEKQVNPHELDAYMK